MSSDIGQDILSSVRADFAKALDDKNGRLGKLFRKIQDGSASMSDISTFSVLIGQTVSSAVGKQITQDVLPDGTLYYNIAQTVLQGVLKDSYELINLAAQTVQERLDSEHGLHIKPVKPDFPEERIRDIAGAASTASMNKNEEKEERRLTSPVENVVQSFYSDYVRENADLRSKAGLNAYIIRRTNGNCCRWCADLAGRYRYEDAPADVYARHDNCTCTVDFVTNNYRQDAWSKRKYSLSPEERRKALEAAPKPTRYTREQAKNLQDSVLNRVANSGNGGIIRDSNNTFLPITQESINRVASLNVFGDERDNRVAEAMRTMLISVRDREPGTETTAIFSLDNMNLIDTRISETADGSVKPLNYDKPFVSIHNHPSSGTFSIADLRQFYEQDKCKALYVVGNNGNVYSWKKTELYNKYDLSNVLTDNLLWGYYSSFEELKEACERCGIRYDERRSNK